ncbi:hypothetical protein KPL71_007969 [Citrus sinensis]|uniref:Uncharacterized protein n=1 Tax=Citrus sinensis TaxID=2711 RepID=A0ACB8M3B4_CITSI|nr:hypothetical protein KPL71_007969 [Citrus sinensis]
MTQLHGDFEVDYESNENASIVYAALAIDKELQPDKVKRQISVINGKLLVHFEAVEARFLRATFSAFLDVLTLATKTIEQFGHGTEFLGLTRLPDLTSRAFLFTPQTVQSDIDFVKRYLLGYQVALSLTCLDSLQAFRIHLAGGILSGVSL